MTEKVAVFGEAKNLVGIVTHPGATAGWTDVAFVLLNAGVIHRVGANRLNVTLARRLAGLGFTALRFDLSGIGDSRPSGSSVAFPAQAIADIRSAVDFLETTCQKRRFVLLGLCSGADNAYAAARQDSRIHGLVLLDPFAYPTWKTSLRLNARRLTSPHWIAGFARPRLRRLVGVLQSRVGGRCATAGQPSEPRQRTYVRPRPPLGDFAAVLREVLDRGGAVMASYSGSSFSQFNYPEQLDDVLSPFGLKHRVHCTFYPRANHTFTELWAQRELVDAIVAWANRSLTRGETPTAASPLAPAAAEETTAPPG